MSMSRTCWVIVLALCFAGSPAMAADVAAGAKAFQQSCAGCHGPNAAGNADLKTPAIASLPHWYVRTQLGKFKAAIRGADARDERGRLMHAVAQTLSDDQATALARHVAALPRHPTGNTLNGDLRRGEQLFREVCMQCHRYDASGERVFGSPPLVGLQDWYIAAQLRKFRARVRGGDARDVKGAKMHRMVSDLGDRDLDGVASFISVLAERRSKEGR